MKVLSAKVLDGDRLDVPVGSLRAGETVTLLVPEAEDAFDLTAEERSLLLEAIAQADRGETVDGWKLLADLEN